MLQESLTAALEIAMLEHTFTTACKPESCKAPDDAEDILGKDSCQLSLLRIGSMYRKT